MKILVINSGSSSIKYSLFDMEDEKVLASGLVERIGDEMGIVTHKRRLITGDIERHDIEECIADHDAGMRLALGLLTAPDTGVISDASDIAGVGHRVVHGGEHFHEPAVIDDTVLDAIESTVPLAPLHNPANLDGIRVALELFPEAPQIAVFDTAFHQSIPARAYMYALPLELYEKDQVRRYGFHGTSHKYVAGECAALLEQPLDETNCITVHLGNGCSITAVENGKSVDTSMGMTPLEGLVMGTRSGDVDPALHVFLKRNKGMELEEVDAMLNKQSGLKGLCGMNDLRDIHTAIDKGDANAKTALQVQTYRIRKYIGAYMGVLGRVDAIIFTAGIGENDPIVRREALRGLEAFGVKVDEEANQYRATSPLKISTDDSSIAVYAIPTNEELAIARESALVLDRN